MASLIPRLVLASLFILGLFIFGWMNRNSDDPAHDTPLETGKRIERVITRPTYAVPECGKSWPPTCPGNHPKPVPKCAQVWPPTCKDNQ